jgi:VIT1/CCC1 family predicted Fe2+/Mn2+ transporter
VLTGRGGDGHPVVAVALVGDWRKNGLKMVAIGLGAAAIGFLIARLFHTTGA